MSTVPNSSTFSPPVAFARMMGIVAGFVLAFAAIILAAAIGQEDGVESCKVVAPKKAAVPNQTPPPTISRSVPI